MLGKRGICAVFVLLFLISFASASFETNSVLLKVSVQEKSSTSGSFSISSDSGGAFALELVNLQGVNISEKNFVLKAGETKKIDVNFDSNGLSPKVYVGSIKISGPSKISYLPVIVEVETVDLFFDLNLDIPPEYSEVSPGNKVVAQIKVFDLVSGGVDNLGAKSVDLTYYIYGIDGGILSSESESVVVEQNTQITKTLVLPKDIKEGSYVFAAVVKYGSSVGSSSQIFSVKKKSFFGVGVTQSSSIWIIVGGIIVFFAILVLFFVYLIKDRDKFIVEMKKYNVSEMKLSKGFLRAQAEARRKKGVSTKLLEKEINEKIKTLRARQEERVTELKVLKKKGNVAEMAKKVKEWKSRGYNTGVLEYKLKGMSKGDMESALAKWKKKYKTEGYKNK